jgi:transglutaminase-like putative cysteine protease
MSVDGASQESSHGPVYGRTVRSSRTTTVTKAAGISRDAHLNSSLDSTKVSSQFSAEQPATAALHGTTILLAVLASAIFIFTDDDSRRLSGSLLLQLMLEAAFMVGAAIVLRRKDVFHRSSAFLMPMLVVVTAAAMLWEPLHRLLFDTGRPLEMMIMNSQKALMLAAAAAGCWPRYQRLSIVIATALSIFCAAITTDQRVQWMIAIFGFAAVSWLVASHWETLRTRLRTEESGRLPLRWLIIGPSIPLLLLLVTAAGGRSTLQSMRGFLPGSGGEDEFDPNSRGGINDGDALVAGAEQIQSFAPIEDAPFAEDDKPSLYDIVNDQFDEPAKKTRSGERAIALGPELMSELVAKMARSKEAGREFSTLRKSGQKNKPRPKDIDSRALFYLAGRTPLHLRMEVYDIFDGVDWIADVEETDQPRGLYLSTLAMKPWIRLPNHSTQLDIHSPVESHAVKVINLRSPVIPAPLELRAVHIDKVDDVTMFGWHSPSVLKMTRKALPELTSINLLTQCVYRDELVDHPDLNFQGMGISRKSQLPVMSEMDQVSRLAREWTAGIPRGYLQIEAICDKLRAGYTLDRTANAPEDHAFPVGHFLFESRRGPDYQFASAATVLLRSLGYSARMVSGFYASPERFDVRKRQTPVLLKDVHFWCEVFAGSGTWVTVEPSPGYELLTPPPTLWSRLQNSLVILFRGIVTHWGVSLLAVVSLSVVWLRRDDVADFCIICTHPFVGARTFQSDVLRTGRLIDWRLRRAGLKRPAGVTLSRWLRQPLLTSSCDVLPEFVRLSEVAAFGSEKQLLGLDRNEVTECCRQVRSRLSLRSCRRLQRQADLERLKNSRSTPPSLFSSNDSTWSTGRMRGLPT